MASTLDDERLCNDSHTVLVQSASLYAFSAAVHCVTCPLRIDVRIPRPIFIFQPFRFGFIISERRSILLGVNRELFR